ncbi:hypothetical protein ALO_00290 [Acetonema longum DSM 6540]|uniref:Uncharacterized protein n=1 Tax=Acetonema longum DSM 6540 TaxID=1009370 RepID=F7NDF1_9FIRM|nr:hypothetical protein ALO_00290 [Acetonema longum DSM 6540]
MLMMAATAAIMRVLFGESGVQLGFYLALYMVNVLAAQTGLFVLFRRRQSFSPLFPGELVNTIDDFRGYHKTTSQKVLIRHGKTIPAVHNHAFTH